MRPSPPLLSRSRARGFGLVDGLVGIFCVLMGTLTVLSLGAMSSKVTRQAEARGVALAAARRQIETLASVSTTNRPGGPEARFDIPGDLAAAFTGPVEGLFSVTDVPSSDGLQQLLVRVRWRNRTAGGGLAPWSEVVLANVVATQPLVVSYTGTTDPPPPRPPELTPTPVEPTAPPKATPDPTPPPPPTSPPAPTEPPPTEEVGGCTYTYGPC